MQVDGPFIFLRDRLFLFFSNYSGDHAVAVLLPKLFSHYCTVQYVYCKLFCRRPVSDGNSFPKLLLRFSKYIYFLNLSTVLYITVS